MNMQEDKRQAFNENEVQENGPSNQKNVANGTNGDDDQHSYPGKLDQVEGRMNNGELGGGIKKEDDEGEG